MKIIITRHFFNQAKRLKKKYLNVKEDLIKALKSFTPSTETSIGRSIYKLRIKSKNINKGKSGGLRLYVYFYRVKNFLIPIYVYSKSEKSSISEAELEYHLQIITKEMIEIIK